jgi:hypothetical protein
MSARASNGSVVLDDRLRAAVERLPARLLPRGLSVGRQVPGLPQVTLSPTPDEQRAIRSDAEHRLVELRRVRDVLLPDADDAAVMSELTTIDSEIRAAEQALKAC